MQKKSNLDPKFLKKAAPQVSFASKKLGLINFQTILLTLFVDKRESNRILISDISECIGCSTNRILHLLKEVDTLVDLNYLKVSKSGI